VAISRDPTPTNITINSRPMLGLQPTGAALAEVDLSHKFRPA